MNHTPAMLAILMATVGLAACDRPTVVNTPPASPVVVPAPTPGPPGPPGEPGKPGQGAIVVVPAPAPAASEPK